MPTVSDGDGRGLEVPQVASQLTRRDLDPLGGFFARLKPHSCRLAKRNGSLGIGIGCRWRISIDVYDALDLMIAS
jgi:hypothetical protein